ncbi:MAG: PotD/PotF family extracellular solute-binding protein [Chloroflexota bacterium]
MSDSLYGKQFDRRAMLRAGLQAGAALGIAGLAGVTTVGGGERVAMAQDSLVDPNAPEWEPTFEPREARKYRWEPLAEGKAADPTNLQVRTIGLGVSVQDRFLNEFSRRTGHATSGKVTTLTAMITEWLAGGAKNYDTNETNANRNAALWDTGLLQPVPVDMVVPWKYARETFTSKDALGYDAVSGYPLTEVWVNPDDQKEFKLVPQFYNCDSIGYRYDLIGEDITSWGAMFDPKYKGKVAILNDSLLTPGWVAGYLKKSGQVQIERTDNMTKEELDQVIEFMIKAKKDGQFRAIWEDYGQCVNLLASGEIWMADAWNPVIEDVKKQDVVCKYAFPEEGFTAWFHGVAVQKDTPNLEAAMDYINFCLEGWWGAQVATQGYYSPTTTCEVYLNSTRNTSPDFTDFEWWYKGGASPDPKKGWPIDGRDTGAYDTRWGNIMHWMTWPSDPDYYAQRWNDFLSA